MTWYEAGLVFATSVSALSELNWCTADAFNLTLQLSIRYFQNTGHGIASDFVYICIQSAKRDHPVDTNVPPNLICW